jgi:hypothetical protein
MKYARVGASDAEGAAAVPAELSGHQEIPGEITASPPIKHDLYFNIRIRR